MQVSLRPRNRITSMTMVVVEVHRYQKIWGWWQLPEWWLSLGCWPQGGILAAKVPRILAGSLKPSGEVLNKNHKLLSWFWYLTKYYTLLLWFWDITKNHPLLSRFYIRRIKYSRNILPSKDIFYSENLCHRKKITVIERNFLSQKEISCHRRKFPVTRRNLLSQEEISCHREKFPVKGRNFLSQEDISCHR